MRICVLSDLHLEFEHFEPAELDIDLVVLAGDIHTRERGIRWANEVFSTEVLYVLGNHEFYLAILTGRWRSPSNWRRAMFTCLSRMCSSGTEFVL